MPTYLDSEPVLHSGQVNPIYGNQGTTFEYLVYYYDEDCGYPPIKNVYINDFYDTMTLKSGKSWDGLYHTYIAGFDLNNMLQPEILILGILLTLFGSIIPYSLIMFSSSRNVESSKQGILLLGDPIGALILGYLLLSEAITFWYVAGGTLLLIAIILILMFSEKTNPKHKW